MPVDDQQLLSEIPFRMRRRIKWGESDPAGIVYTARFSDFMMEALDSWLMHVVGNDWFRMNLERGIGSPMVHSSCDYHSRISPGDLLDVSVTLAHIGRSSYTVDIPGHRPDGTHVFQGKAVSVIISRQTWKSVAIPDDYRERMEAYMHACGKPRD